MVGIYGGAEASLGLVDFLARIAGRSGRDRRGQSAPARSTRGHRGRHYTLIFVQCKGIRTDRGYPVAGETCRQDSEPTLPASQDEAKILIYPRSLKL